MITVSIQSLYSIQQWVNVPYTQRILNPLLQQPQPPLPVLITYVIHHCYVLIQHQLQIINHLLLGPQRTFHLNNTKHSIFNYCAEHFSLAVYKHNWNTWKHWQMGRFTTIFIQLKRFGRDSMKWELSNVLVHCSVERSSKNSLVGNHPYTNLVFLGAFETISDPKLRMMENHLRW